MGASTLSKDAYYFPHDSNAKDDPKCILLIEQLGLEGYGIYWVLIETLRDQPGYKYPIALLPALARRFNTTHEKMKTVIYGYGLFTVIEDEFFFSKSLAGRMIVLERKREQARLAGEASARKRQQLLSGGTPVERTFNDSSTGVQPVNKSKVNKNKEKNIKVKDKKTYNDFFESLWTLYPNKKGKAQVSDSQKAKLFDIGFEELSRCITRYKTTKEDWKAWQNGSTFFNSGYVDYLDCNFKGGEIDGYNPDNYKQNKESGNADERTIELLRQYDATGEINI